MMEMTAANHKRDARLRQKILMSLYLGARTAPSGRLSGRLVKDLVDGIAAGDGFESDDHALALMRDLKSAGFVEEKQSTRKEGQRFTLDHCEFGITAAGVALHTQASVKHPLVWDDRVEPEE